MAKIRNTSPLGALDIDALKRRVEAGEEFEVTDETLAAQLISQGFEPVNDEAKALVTTAPESAEDTPEETEQSTAEAPSEEGETHDDAA